MKKMCEKKHINEALQEIKQENGMKKVWTDLSVPKKGLTLFKQSSFLVFCFDFGVKYVTFSWNWAIKTFMMIEIIIYSSCIEIIKLTL